MCTDDRALWRELDPEGEAEHERRLDALPGFLDAVGRVVAAVDGRCLTVADADAEDDADARRRGLERDDAGRWDYADRVAERRQQHQCGEHESERWSTRPPRDAAPVAGRGGRPAWRPPRGWSGR